MQNTNPPQVAIEPQVVGINSLKAFSSLFTVFDPDPNSQVTLYRFRDNGIDGGRFLRNGVVQAANTWIEIPSANLASISYRGDTAKSQETFNVQVFDGVFWSNIAQGTITTGNSSPLLLGLGGKVAPYEYKPLSSFFREFDPDGDPILRYQVIDRNQNANGGYLALRGQRLPSAVYQTIEAGDLPTLEYRGGEFGPQQEVVSIRAFDGFSWSEEADFTMVTNGKSDIVGNNTVVLTNEMKPVLQLFSVSDPDGDPVFAYNFIDRQINANGGYFLKNGVRQESGKWFSVNFQDITNVFYVGGSTAPQFETVGIQVYDGTEFSEIVNTEVKTTERPAVTGRLGEVKANQFLNFATGSTANVTGVIGSNSNPLLTVTEDIVEFRVIDRRLNANGGYFMYQGARLPSATWIPIPAANLIQLEYVGGAFGPQSETIGIQALANGVWSPISDFTINTLKNIFRPELVLGNVDARAGTVLNLTSMFSWSDGDNDILRSFGFYDTGSDPSSGYFTVNDVIQPARTWVILNYDQIGNVKYHMPNNANTEKMRMFVSDGTLVSVQQTATLNSVRTPIVTVVDTDIQVDTLESRPLSNFFVQTDGGPAMTMWQVYDETFSQTPDRSGRLYLRAPGGGDQGEELFGGIVHTLLAEEFARTEFSGAEVDNGRQLDSVIVRGTNGITGWSEWTRINFTTDPVGSASIDSPRKVNNTGPGPKTVITYTFVDGNANAGGQRDNPNSIIPDYYGLSVRTPCNMVTVLETEGTRSLAPPQRDEMRRLLELFESYANLDFVEKAFTGGSDVDMAIGAWGATAINGVTNAPEFDCVGGGAYGYAPFTGSGLGSLEGDVWFNRLAYDPDVAAEANAVGLGTNFRRDALTAIATTLGLSGPGNPNLSIFTNFDYNTAMSFVHDSNFNQYAPYPEPLSSMMLWDLEVLQDKYGANTDYRSGNDHYGNLFSGSYPHFVNNNESHQTTLWDGGGFDTLNYTNHVADESIDLREGWWSTINGVPQSLRISYGTVIENARGGSGNDILHGNEIANLLFGNAGNDVFIGSGGNDVMRGGADDDTYIWRLGDGRDTIREEGAGGTETLQIFDSSGQITSTEDDLFFRRIGNDLRIDLTFDRGVAQGTVLISDFINNAASRVEILQIHGVGNTQIGGDIDLTSVLPSIDTLGKRYTVTTNVGTNGFLLAPVS